MASSVGNFSKFSLHTASVSIKGLEDASCAVTVQTALRTLRGVLDARVDYELGIATLEYDPSSLQTKEILNEIEGLGYEAKIEDKDVEAGVVANANVNSAVLGIEGMTCSSCSGTVENTLTSLPGVTNVSVVLATNTATFKYDTKMVSISKISEEIEDVGFGVEVLQDHQPVANNQQTNDLNKSDDLDMGELRQLMIVFESFDDSHTKTKLSSALPALCNNVLTIDGVESAILKEDDDQINVSFNDAMCGPRDFVAEANRLGMNCRIASLGGFLMASRLLKSQAAESKRLFFLLMLAVALTVPILFITMVLPLIPAVKSYLQAEAFPGLTVNGALLFLLSSPVQFYVGNQFHTKAWKTVKTRTLGMDFLVSTGTFAAYAYSLSGLISGVMTGVSSDKDVEYFETSAVLITAVLLGKYLETYAKGQTANAIHKLSSMKAQSARLVRSGTDAAVREQRMLRREKKLARKRSKAFSPNRFSANSSAKSQPSGKSQLPAEDIPSDTATVSPGRLKRAIELSDIDGSLNSFKRRGEQGRPMLDRADEEIRDLHDIYVSESQSNLAQLAASFSDENDEKKLDVTNQVASSDGALHSYEDDVIDNDDFLGIDMDEEVEFGVDIENNNAAAVSVEQRLSPPLPSYGGSNLRVDTHAGYSLLRDCRDSRIANSDSTGNDRINDYDYNSFSVHSDSEDSDCSLSSCNGAADGHEQIVDAALLHRGDILRLVAGEAVPADGQLLRGGNVGLDEAMMTGESATVARQGGDTVFGGTTVVEGSALMRISAVGDHSTLGRIITTVQEAQAAKPPIQELADRVARYFVPVIALISLSTWAVWVLCYSAGWVPPAWYASAGSPYLMAFFFALAVWVSACPCAFGLATPTAVLVSTGVAAKHGILVRRGAALQYASEITAVCFDKTGTLTKGSTQITDFLYCVEDGDSFVPLSSAGDGPGFDDWGFTVGELGESSSKVQAEYLLQLLLFAENRSSHPLAKGICAYCKENLEKMSEDEENDRREYNLSSAPLPMPEAQKAVLPNEEDLVFHVVPGMGVCMYARHGVSSSTPHGSSKNNLSTSPTPEGSTVTTDDVATATHRLEVLVGSVELLESKNVIVPTEAIGLASSYRAGGKVAVFMALNGSLRIIMAVADAVRPESPFVVAALKQRGIACYMLTGDEPATAFAIGKVVGIAKKNITARAKPDDKKLFIEQLQSAGECVAFVGDGTNDSPALASANVGLTMASGSDIAVESGDMVLVKNNLHAVLTSFDLAATTMRRIKINYFWALCYNACLVPLAAGILYPAFQIALAPMFAGGAMALSSVSIVLSSLLLLRYEPPKSKDAKKVVVVSTTPETIKSSPQPATQCNCPASSAPIVPEEELSAFSQLWAIAGSMLLGNRPKRQYYQEPLLSEDERDFYEMKTRRSREGAGNRLPQKSPNTVGDNAPKSGMERLRASFGRGSYEIIGKKSLYRQSQFPSSPLFKIDEDDSSSSVGSQLSALQGSSVACTPLLDRSVSNNSSSVPEQVDLEAGRGTGRYTNDLGYDDAGCGCGKGNCKCGADCRCHKPVLRVNIKN